MFFKSVAASFALIYSLILFNFLIETLLFRRRLRTGEKESGEAGDRLIFNYTIQLHYSRSVRYSSTNFSATNAFCSG